MKHFLVGSLRSTPFICSQQVWLEVIFVVFSRPRNYVHSFFIPLIMPVASWNNSKGSDKNSVALNLIVLPVPWKRGDENLQPELF